MNQNFVGAPDREDLRILDQLRRQLLPMIAVMDKLQAEMQFRMSRGEGVDWPQIHRTTSLVTSYLASFNVLINGGYKHSTEPSKETRRVPKKDESGNIITNEDGTPVLETKEFPKTLYRDIPLDAHADTIKALHPFPIPPFPIMQPNAMGMANTLLRKRLEPMEEGWVEQRLRKAAEFAHVPPEWGIEPKKRDTKDEKDNDSDDDDNTEDGAERMPTKRVKATLSEDDIMTLWKFAHQEVFDQQYLKAKYPEDYGAGEGDAEDGEEEDGSEYEDEDEDEAEADKDDFEDVMDTSGAPESSQPKPEAPAPRVVGRAAMAVKPAVHQPVPGLPVLSLGFVHKFMANGDVTGQ